MPDSIACQTNHNPVEQKMKRIRIPVHQQWNRLVRCTALFLLLMFWLILFPCREVILAPA